MRCCAQSQGNPVCLAPPGVSQSATAMPATQETPATTNRFALPDAGGHFGPYGGVFVPETLMTALAELGAAYTEAKNDPVFQAELRHHLREFAGRPSPLYFAERLTAHGGGAKIYLKREDLLHTGAAQDQQRARTGAAGPPHGKETRDRRNWRRPARRRHGGGVREVWL